MLGIQKIDHVGMRISDRDRSVAFYRQLGFRVISDHGYLDGHPIIMVHDGGMVLNPLGPATIGAGENVLMDTDDKYPGYTHVAVKIDSLQNVESLLAEKGIAITGRHQFGGMTSIFVRDPDRNVLEIVGPGQGIADRAAGT